MEKILIFVLNIFDGLAICLDLILLHVFNNYDLNERRLNFKSMSIKRETLTDQNKASIFYNIVFHY